MQNDFIVILFYKFIHIANPEAVMRAHKEKGKELGLTGRVIIAEEGINATFEGTHESIEKYKEFLHNDPLFSDVLVKESAGTGTAFSKLSVRVRDEIVTLEAGKFDVGKETAQDLSGAELEKWYENNEDFVVLDLRNSYEIASGKFDKTIDPGLDNFRDLPKKLKEMKDLKNKKIVTVCTGGIRCEKATCLLKREGFSNIYKLKDGIHTYMQKFPGKHFNGTLFVFDNRMTTDVVPNSKKSIIGRCFFCEVPTENYCSDDSVRPSKKLLCCSSCFEKEGEHLRESVSS